MDAKRRSVLVVIGLMLLSWSCGQRDQEAADQSDSVGEAPADDSMASMPGMGSVSGSQMSTEMTAHMQRMEGMRGDSLMQMIPQHRQMLGNMISQMEREMQGMNMVADARWSALTDSLRIDLTGMPNMSSAEMEALMPAHHGRVTRLMEMHRSMMPRG